MNFNYQPLHHKYRPKTFDELIGQTAITSTLKQALIKNKIAPAYLFSGPRGTGKTSSARILAKSLNCLNSTTHTIEPCGTCEQCKTISNSVALDVIEIDAASNTGVDNIRELIEKSRFAPVQARWKVYVIDECHMLSSAAFNALLKTLEEPPKNTVFILATTDPQRLLPTIISRCQHFYFRQISEKDLTEYLHYIAKKEDISIEYDALKVIAQRAEGGLRDAESLLDQLSLLPQPIQLNDVYQFLGIVPINEIIGIANALIETDAIELISKIRLLIDEGREAMSILHGLASILRDLILIKIAPQRKELHSMPKNYSDSLNILSQKVSLETLYQYQKNLKSSEQNLKNSIQPRLWIEVLLLGMINPKNQNDIQNIEQNQLIKENEYKVKNTNQKESLNFQDKEYIQKEHKIDVESSKENLLIAWDKILAHIELPSTKMLLSQQAKIYNLTDKKIEISVSSNWIGMIQSRKSILSRAIEQALGSSKEIILTSEITPNIANQKGPSDQIIQQQPNQKKTCEEMSQQIQKKLNVKKEGSVDSTEIDLSLEGAKDFAKFFNGTIIDNNEND